MSSPDARVTHLGTTVAGPEPVWLSFKLEEDTLSSHERLRCRRTSVVVGTCFLPVDAQGRIDAVLIWEWIWIVLLDTSLPMVLVDRDIFHLESLAYHQKEFQL